MMNQGNIKDEKHIILSFILFGLLHLDKEPVKNPSNPLFYIPYFRILPKEFHSPLFYKSHQLKWLYGTELDVSVEMKNKYLQEEFSRMIWLHELHPTKEITFDMYMHAEAIFLSRSLSFHSFQDLNGQKNQDDVHLVAFLDFFNHNLHPDVSWTPIGNGIVLDSLEKHEIHEVQMENQELFISYGHKSNSELLFTHGFCLNDNPHDSIRLRIPFIEEMCDLNENSVENVENVENWINLKKECMKSLDLNSFIHLNHLKSYSCVSEFISSMPSLYLSVIMEQDQVLQVKNNHIYFIEQEISNVHVLKESIKALKLYPMIILRILSLLINILHYKQSSLMDSADLMPQEGCNQQENEILNSIGILKMGQLDLIQENILQLQEWMNELSQ